MLRRALVPRWAAASVAVATFGVLLPAPSASGAPRPPGHAPAGATLACDTLGKQMVTGTPHMASGAVPAIRSVQIVPNLGGLLVLYRFRPGFRLAPEGVYFAWSVYIYRHRRDAANSTLTVQLQIEDRGTGWEPTGWNVLASTYYNARPVAGNVKTDKARDAISFFFPPGFVDLKPPFYWYASQEVLRAYLPRRSRTARQDWSVNGSIVRDCPGGVRPNTSSLPSPAKLLAAG